MSIDQQDRSRPPSPDGGPDRHEPPKSSLSVAQVIGGALAAMTAAALGSRLSLAGTVIGAAVASVVAAVAGALYTASLRRTSQHVSAVLTRVRPTSGSGPAEGPTASNPTVSDPRTVGTPRSSATDTTVDPATGWALPAEPSASASAATGAPGGRTRIGWKTVVVAAVSMFVLAALALTGLELATGRALSGGTGTTVGQVAEPTTRPSVKPTPSASATPSARPTASPTASTSSSPRPSATSSSTASSEPTPRPSTSTNPTPTPTRTLSAAPSPTPSAPGAPAAPGASSGATPAS